MASRRYVSFSLISLAATTLLLSATCGDARSLLQAPVPFCNTADDGILCATLAHGATTWNEAMENVIKAILELAKPGKALVNGVKAKLPPKLEAVTKDSIASTCKESYESLLDALTGSLNDVKSGDQYSFNVKLSAASSSFSDCTDGMDEFGVGLQEFTDLGNAIQKAVSAALAVAETKPK